MLRTTGFRSGAVASVLTMSCAGVSLAPSQPAAASGIPTTRDGRPDFHGSWTNATATTLERPDEFANRAFRTEAEATAYHEANYAIETGLRGARADEKATQKAKDR
jgi:hypothetical protein